MQPLRGMKPTKRDEALESIASVELDRVIGGCAACGCAGGSCDQQQQGGGGAGLLGQRRGAPPQQQG